MSVKFETEIEYGGWPNCVRLTNGVVDLVATADVGPRVIRFGLVGEENEFKEYEAQLGATGGDRWRTYGGHRLWYAPEDPVRTYYPDNAPVTVEQRGDFVRLVQRPETLTGIQKEIDLYLADGEPCVEVVHRLRNAGGSPVELAPWALSVMAPGGTAIVPLPRRGEHEGNLLPVGGIALWAYTDMTDPRWTWGSRYALLRQSPQVRGPQKAGFTAPDGWAAYARGGHLFVKRFSRSPGASYPDFGSAVEVFADSEMLELETLGPLVTLPPGAAVEHRERWSLFRDVPPPVNEADVDVRVAPKAAD